MGIYQYRSHGTVTRPIGANASVTLTATIAKIGGTSDTKVFALTVIANYTIGGTISGVILPGLVLRNNGGNDLSVTTGATTFTFSTPVAPGTGYTVTIPTIPAGMSCGIASGTGTANANVTTVNITCGSNATVFTSRTLPNPNGGWYLTAVYGNGRFVTVSANSNPGTVVYSDNGTTWTAASHSVNSVQWYGLAYGNGRYVATGNNMAITSVDGITWTQPTIPTGNWNSITYGAGLFVAVSTGGGQSIATSPDGITWTLRSTALPSSQTWQPIAFGNGVFVVIAQNTSVAATSADGITWTQRTLPATASWNWVTYGVDRFVAVGTGTNAIFSTDNGVTWTTATTPPASGTWNKVTYGNGLFLAVAGQASSTMASTSPDGITWTAKTLPSPAN